MGEDAVGADGENVGAGVEEVLVEGGDRRQLGGSDEAKIGAVEEDEQPPATVAGQAYLLRPAA